MDNRGFTLAEILITLGIVGVVAALTIPNLITSYKAHQYKSKFLKVYSTLSQVTLNMKEDGISTNPKDHAFGELRTIFVNYMPGAITTSAYSYNLPFWNPSTQGHRAYKTLNGSALSSSMLDDGQIVLADGTNLFLNQGGITANYLISADLNGYTSPPNRWGHDLLTFELLTTGELVPAGNPKSHYADKNKYCNLKSTDQLNGIACASLVLEDTSYFKWMLRQH